jgi:hypothetical protein
MARPPLYPPIDPEQGMLLYLGAVADLPWATPPVIEAYSGLFGWEIDRFYRPTALQRGWIERGDIPCAQRRAMPRFGPTPEAAHLLGRAWQPKCLQAALLQALTLDAGHRLVAEWVDQAIRVVWALSPFVLPVEAVRPLRRAKSKEVDPEYRYRSVQFGIFAALQTRRDPERYAHVAVLLDPGDIHLAWFRQQFRSLYAWRRRSEFRGSPSAFPLVVFIAVNDARRVQLAKLWRASALPGMSVLRLRLTTYAELTRNDAAPRQWWDEGGQRVSWSSGLNETDRPGIRPVAHLAGWWGYESRSIDDLCPRRSARRFAPRAKEYPIIAHAKRTAKYRRDPLSSKLVRWQLNLKAQWRWILRCVGNYPLLSVTNLALVMGISKAKASLGLSALRRNGLVECCPDHIGHVLTWEGVALVAAQAGVPPDRYAELRRWPVVCGEDGRARYSVEALLAHADHTELVLGFLAGLRRFGPQHGVLLTTWDHVLCVETFPDSRRERGVHRAIPDASGRVRLPDGATISFWLEVDRGTVQGRALTQKLTRYYAVGGLQRGIRARVPRILIVVAPGDEARLLKLQRRIRGLDDRYQVRLNVRLTRADLLGIGRGWLDPLRSVWRTAYASNFVSPFDAIGERRATSAE